MSWVWEGPAGGGRRSQPTHHGGHDVLGAAQHVVVEAPGPRRVLLQLRSLQRRRQPVVPGCCSCCDGATAGGAAAGSVLGGSRRHGLLFGWIAWTDGLGWIGWMEWRRRRACGLDWRRHRQPERVSGACMIESRARPCIDRYYRLNPWHAAAYVCVCVMADGLPPHHSILVGKPFDDDDSS